jgi:pimeloyl-ACP methyl ester carboxylesterase
MASSTRVLRSYYDTPEGQVHFRYIKTNVKDTSKSPVLFLHMSATSSAYYEKLIQRYALEGYDCYAPDMPGLVATL